MRCDAVKMPLSDHRLTVEPNPENLDISTNALWDSSIIATIKPFVSPPSERLYRSGGDQTAPETIKKELCQAQESTQSA
jgi:hypothetical protein